LDAFAYLWYYQNETNIHHTPQKLKVMENVIVKMEDLFTGETVVRTICATAAYKSGSVTWEKGDEKSQRQQLERWIKERANQQHDTELALISWEFTN
jgi:hypothetical protein